MQVSLRFDLLENDSVVVCQGISMWNWDGISRRVPFTELDNLGNVQLVSGNYWVGLREDCGECV